MSAFLRHDHGPVTGAILAGGRASRFGGAPKGLAQVGDRRVIDRVADALRAVPCAELLVVSDAPDAPSWLDDARVVSDVRPGLGALGGIHAALTHAAGPVLVVAWDMPFVSASLLVALYDAVSSGAPASMPDGEPLCACYGAACLTAVEQLLDSGERRATALAASVGAVVLGANEITRHGDPSTLFMNVNTSDDLAVARTIVIPADAGIHLAARPSDPARANGGGFPHPRE